MQLVEKKEQSINQLQFDVPTPKINFFQALVTLLSGGVVAQLLPYMATIFLAHLFEPTEFAYFAIFTAISAALSIVATGRYELAVPLPGDEIDANALILLTGLIGAVTSIIVSIAVFFLFFAQYISNTFWFYLPAAMLAISVFQAMIYWFLRHGLYGYITCVRFIQAGITSLTSLVLGLKGYDHGLIAGYVAGWMGGAATCVFLASYVHGFTLGPALGRIKFNAIKFSNHAIYGAIPALIDCLSIISLIFIIKHHYGDVYAGQYNISKQFAYVPVSLFIASIGQIILKESSELLRQKRSDKFLFNKISFYLICTSILYILILIISAPMLFPLFLGSKWVLAGDITTILALGYGIRLLVVPLSSLITTHQALPLNGAWLIVYFITINSLYFFKPNDPLYFFVGLTIVDLVLYLIYFLLIYYVVYKKQV